MQEQEVLLYTECHYMMLLILSAIFSPVRHICRRCFSAFRQRFRPAHAFAVPPLFAAAYSFYPLSLAFASRCFAFLMLIASHA